MRIAVASGKGGTGKTTVATNLAAILADSGLRASYIDCDVEEPNGHIFLKPEFKKRFPAKVRMPQVDQDKCNGCGKCGEICQFSAIVCVAEEVLTFPELCHSCAGCSLVCPEEAIQEVERDIGTIESGTAGDVQFFHGRMNVGEARSQPLIQTLKREMPENGFTILDAPPGTSCPVIETVRGTHYVLLVTEPTPFGLTI